MSVWGAIVYAAKYGECGTMHNMVTMVAEQTENSVDKIEKRPSV